MYKFKDGGSSYTPPVKKTVQSQKSTVVKAVVKTDDPSAETSLQSKASNKTLTIEESPDSDDDDPDIPEIDASRVKSPLGLLIKHKNQFIKSQVIMKDGPVITDDKNDDTQSVTGNIETENVGTENGVSGEVTNVEPYYYSNPFGVEINEYNTNYDYDFWDIYKQVRSVIPEEVSSALIQEYLTDEIIEGITNNAEEVVNNVVQKIVAGTAIQIPVYPGVKTVSLFDGVSKTVVTGTKTLTKELSEEVISETSPHAIYSNRTQAVTSYGLGVVVGAAYDILVNKEDVSDAIGESVVKTGMSMIMTQFVAGAIVGTGALFGVTIPLASIPLALIGLNLTGSFVAESWFDNSSVVQQLSKGISSLVEGVGSLFGFEW